LFINERVASLETKASSSK